MILKLAWSFSRLFIENDYSYETPHFNKHSTQLLCEDTFSSDWFCLFHVIWFNCIIWQSVCGNGSEFHSGLLHYTDVTMSAMVSQITSFTIVYSTNHLIGRWSKKTPKLCVVGLWERNSPVTGEFPARRASNTENVSIWWRNHAILGFALALVILSISTGCNTRNWGCWPSGSGLPRKNMGRE